MTPNNPKNSVYRLYNEAYPEVVKKVRVLTAAFFDLRDAWEKAEDLEDAMNIYDYMTNYISFDYPFDKSLDELCFEVSNWKEAVNEWEEKGYK